LTLAITNRDLGSTEREKRLSRERSDATVRVYNCWTDRDVGEAARSTDARPVQWAPRTAHVIRELTKCRVVRRHRMAVDMSDVDAATGAGMAVASAQGYCSEEVAKHAKAMLLGLVWVLSGAWRARARGLRR
jgi:D-3-phosphoglycerate dehydrogenase